MSSIFDELRTRLEASLALDHFEVEDFAKGHQHHDAYTGGAHLNTIIVSNAFNGMDLIDRHRKIYEIVNDLMQNEIHALSMKTYTPEEWTTIKEKSS